jgi:hypothetical protein
VPFQLCNIRSFTLLAVIMVLPRWSDGGSRPAVANVENQDFFTVSARVELTPSPKRANDRHSENVLVWLTPVGTSSSVPVVPNIYPPRLTQHNKSFFPHMLVVPVGAEVAFPNHDPFFHNVFSLFEGKRFDLGLYEAGTTRNVRFDKPGISYIFCNIHAEMSAIIVALTTPYYGISNSRGEIIVPHVPPGKYILRIWYETALPEALEAMTRQIVISRDQVSLGLFRVACAIVPQSHKNKYGEEYNPPAPDNPAYERP